MKEFYKTRFWTKNKPAWEPIEIEVTNQLGDWMNEHILIRYTAPTRYDDGLYGQICRVETEELPAHYYIQISKTQGENKWIKMGDCLENIFRDKFNDPDWVFSALQDYE